jgi:hypothetical protein
LQAATELLAEGIHPEVAIGVVSGRPSATARMATCWGNPACSR